MLSPLLCGLLSLLSWHQMCFFFSLVPLIVIAFELFSILKITAQAANSHSWKRLKCCTPIKTHLPNGVFSNALPSICLTQAHLDLYSWANSFWKANKTLEETNTHYAVFDVQDNIRKCQQRPSTKARLWQSNQIQTNKQANPKGGELKSNIR